MIVRERRRVVVKVDADGQPVRERDKLELVVLHRDIIKDEPFWTVDHPGLLSS